MGPAHLSRLSHLSHLSHLSRLLSRASSAPRTRGRGATAAGSGSRSQGLAVLVELALVVLLLRAGTPLSLLTPLRVVTWCCCFRVTTRELERSLAAARRARSAVYVWFLESGGGGHVEDRRGDAWVTLSRFCTRVGGPTSYRYSGRPDRGRDRGQHRRHALALVTCRNLSPLNTRHGRARRLVSQHDGYSRRGAVSRCRVAVPCQKERRKGSKRRNAISPPLKETQCHLSAVCPPWRSDGRVCTVSRRVTPCHTMLSRSDGRVCSTLHRVRMPTRAEADPPRARHSLAFFMQV